MTGRGRSRKQKEKFFLVIGGGLRLDGAGTAVRRTEGRPGRQERGSLVKKQVWTASEQATECIRQGSEHSRGHTHTSTHIVLARHDVRVYALQKWREEPQSAGRVPETCPGGHREPDPEVQVDGGPHADGGGETQRAAGRRCDGRGRGRRRKQQRHFYDRHECWGQQQQQQKQQRGEGKEQAQCVAACAIVEAVEEQRTSVSLLCCAYGSSGHCRCCRCSSIHTSTHLRQFTSTTDGSGGHGRGLVGRMFVDRLRQVRMQPHTRLSTAVAAAAAGVVATNTLEKLHVAELALQ